LGGPRCERPRPARASERRSVDEARPVDRTGAVRVVRYRPWTGSRKRATPAGGESGGRLAVRLWGGRAGPVLQESFKQVTRTWQGFEPPQATSFRMETHRMLPDHERYVEVLAGLSKNFSHSQRVRSTGAVATRVGTGHKESPFTPSYATNGMNVDRNTGMTKVTRKALGPRGFHPGETDVKRDYGPAGSCTTSGTHARPAAGGVSRRA